MHNYYAETSHDMDDMLERFLVDVLGPEGKNEPNLAVRIYADHGDHSHYIRDSNSGDLDRMSPIMINIVPK
jgi:hypothetical protein